MFNFLLFTYVVPQVQSLLPSVMKIDTLTVERIVRSLSTRHTISTGADDTPITKKVARDVMEYEETSNDVEMSDVDVAMNVDDTDESYHPSPCSAGATGSSVCTMSPAVLYEYTANNCNVLHVCVARKDRDEDTPAKQFIPFKGDYIHIHVYTNTSTHVHVVIM